MKVVALYVVAFMAVLTRGVPGAVVQRQDGGILSTIIGGLSSVLAPPTSGSTDSRMLSSTLGSFTTILLPPTSFPSTSASASSSTTTVTTVSPSTTSIPDQECVSIAKYQGVYHGRFSEPCALLASACRSKISGGLADIWSDRTCVAAATCQGTYLTVGAAGCINPSIKSIGDDGQQSLNYNLYAEIVGECAWAPGGCPITQQNFIDFFYGTLSSIDSTVWPDVQRDVIELWWGSIKGWALTGDTVPYLNFNDWLHWSHS
ncbi:hypothetical protein VNI00_016887 [Paramarasmius palmivorus]|uniref:Uncharacterized protein n=1 Tax=Paramarasmius palmivorus TaxID=297713 RepID=A0AAW0BC87_9AGAR